MAFNTILILLVSRQRFVLFLPQEIPHTLAAVWWRGWLEVWPPRLWEASQLERREASLRDLAVRHPHQDGETEGEHVPGSTCKILYDAKFTLYSYWCANFHDCVYVLVTRRIMLLICKSSALTPSVCFQRSNLGVFQELCSILGEDSLLVEETTATDVTNDNGLSD